MQMVEHVTMMNSHAMSALVRKGKKMKNG